MIFLRLFILFALCITTPLRSQISTNPLDYKASILEYQMAKKTNGTPSTSLIADNSIDETCYLIGSGDEFAITFLNMPSINYSGLVNVNGDLFLSEFGFVNVGGLTLQEAKKIISSSFAKSSGKSIYVVLSGVKKATVTVSGQITNPGTYNESGVKRLLDIVKLANNDSLPPVNQIDFRTLKCVTKNDVHYYDLYKYLNTGDLSQNPYIYPGDQICLEKASRRVFISGEVLNACGLIPIKQNENITDFLNLFTLSEAADSQNIIVQPASSKQQIIVDLKISSDYQLHDQDVIIVPRKSNYPEVLLVSISGEINKPGSYPIHKKAITAQDIINQAGGIKDNSDESRIVIIRKGKRALNQTNGGISEMRPEITTAIGSMNSKKDYSLIYLRDNKSIYLEPSDLIYIPKEEGMVYVSGYVKRPGAVPYVQGKKLAYYVSSAGGLQNVADKSNIQISSIYESVTITKNSGMIEDGDYIIVPMSQENKKLSTLVLPIISTSMAILSTMLAIFVNLR